MCLSQFLLESIVMNDVSIGLDEAQVVGQDGATVSVKGFVRVGNSAIQPIHKETVNAKYFIFTRRFHCDCVTLFIMLLLVACVHA